MAELIEMLFWGADSWAKEPYIGWSAHCTWRMRLNDLCALAMWPYVRLLWPLVTVVGSSRPFLRSACKLYELDVTSEFSWVVTDHVSGKGEQSVAFAFVCLLKLCLLNQLPLILIFPYVYVMPVAHLDWKSTSKVKIKFLPMWDRPFLCSFAFRCIFKEVLHVRKAFLWKLMWSDWPQLRAKVVADQTRKNCPRSGSDQLH